jgi:lipopolysaccharide transport system ATP-binding protein
MSESELAIRVEGIGKRYDLGAADGGQPGYRTLRDAIVAAAAAPARWARRRRPSAGGPPAEDPSTTLWALRDVSFDVRPGEVVGVIGRNGAGKSTLLKILSRITAPTRGTIDLVGRVGSLLEVGTGFHPELTGRENIFLNAAILGMSRAEVARKFDEIVAFSEVERFLDTPVKRYSSGMYVRLAFAVAAHLEPEILIVDEVLAVGDAAFQKKCLGKIGEVAGHGRTVLFVSHNMGAVANLCTRAILLDGGRVAADGPAASVVGRYIELGRVAQGEVAWPDPATAPGNAKVRLRAVRVLSGGAVTADAQIDQPVRVEVDFWNYVAGARLTTSIHLLDPAGGCVLASANLRSATLGRDPWYDRPHPVGLYRATCEVPANFLNEGRYGVSAFVLTDVMNIEAAAKEVASFTVHETGAMRAEYAGAWIGVVRPKLAWQTEQLDAGDPSPAAASAQEVPV